MSRTIAIGDIHGCLAALNALIDVIKPTAEDTIVTVGDYVDRGPDSKGVIDRLIELEKSIRLVPLMGNHEEMMLSVLERRTEPYGWLGHGGVQTMESYDFAGDLSCVPEEHLDFIRRMPSYFETDSHFIVHANYDPIVPLDEQTSEMLRWKKITEILPTLHMSGKRAILGHTHDRQGEIFEVPQLICIDTYCYGGKWLTALELESGQVWQASPMGFLR